MSPQAGWILQEEIAPRIAGAVPRSILCVGAEDNQELVHDGIRPLIEDTESTDLGMALENIRNKNSLSPITKNLIQKLAGQKGGDVDWGAKIDQS